MLFVVTGISGRVSGVVSNSDEAEWSMARIWGSGDRKPLILHTVEECREGGG